MTTDGIEFYLRHRAQITEWARLHKRVENFMRDAVNEGATEKAIKLLTGSFGDPEADFYVRNRALITEWDALQAPAGLALHDALIRAAELAQYESSAGVRGFHDIIVAAERVPASGSDRQFRIVLFWGRRDLLTTGRGYPFPRLILDRRPNEWTPDETKRLLAAATTIARDLGMTEKGDQWVRYGMLPPIAEGQDLDSYAAQCIASAEEAARRLLPMVREVCAALPPVPDPPV